MAVRGNRSIESSRTSVVELEQDVLEDAVVVVVVVVSACFFVGGVLCAVRFLTLEVEVILAKLTCTLTPMAAPAALHPSKVSMLQ